MTRAKYENKGDGMLVLCVGGAALYFKRMPLGWLFTCIDAHGHAAMLPVPDAALPELRGFLQDASTEVD